MTAPRLTRRDLQVELDRLFGANRAHFLLAFHGTGDEDLVDVRGTRVRVVPVRGELELRRRLLDVGAEDRVAFLVPWSVEVPLDLQHRFARKGRVLRIGREARLAAMFGVSEVDGSLRDAPLAEYLLTHHAGETFPVAGGRLTVDAMWAAWLDRTCGLESGGEIALDVLVGWAAIDGRGAQFTETIAGRSTEVRDALVEHLRRRLGPAGPAVWKAWEAGRGATALELALVVGALGTAATDDRAVATWVRTVGLHALGDAATPEALAQLGAVADTALRYVERRAGAERVRRLVNAADGRADDEILREHLVASTRLPSAWRARLDRLGESLAAVAAAPSVATAQLAIERMRSLSGHELYQAREHTAVVRRAEMAVRIATWLATRPDREVAASMTPFGDVEALASWYVREGGYLDWARRAARGVPEGAFGRGVASVLAAADEARQALDRRFARALPAWHEARRPATAIVPIDQAVKRLATAFLDEEPDRRLLVVLMDGMAWAQAAEMLESMGQQASVWGPLAWHGIGAHRIGDAPFPPVLASFPTITEISRAAFFAGKPMPVGPRPDTQQDPSRWQANRDAQRYWPANEAPQLLLRGENQTADGSARPEALSRVEDRTHRLVAVVINAIDMSLKSDAAHQHVWTLDTVKSLRDLLDAAARSGRAVLLCSDHGHVPSDRLQASGAMQDGGARWRPWKSPDEPIAEHEVALKAGEGVWAPRGAHGVVLLSDDGHRYGGGAGSGEHGGASLAEAIAPCLFIGNADVPGAVDDRGQAVRPARAPSWWHFHLDASPLLEDTAVERRMARKPRPSNQLPLTAVGAPPAPEPVAPAPRKPVESPLSGSPLLEARASRAADRERAVLAVELLRARNGVMDAAALATELGEFAARVNGLVSRLQEVLNVDGYQILRYDRVNKQVHLDVQKLAQQFEIEL